MKIFINAVQKEVYFNETLLSNLDCLCERVEKKWDDVIYIFGEEGDGKSTFAAQICAYLDPNFCLNNVCWNRDQFLKLVDELPIGSAILLDEAFSSFSTASARTALGTAIISRMTTIRRKRLHLIIVAPLLFEMSKYLICHRTRAAFRIYETELERGYFWGYDRERLRALYRMGKKEENYLAVKPTFSGRFGSWFPLDEAEYDKRKEEGTKEGPDKRLSEKEYKKAAVEGAYNVISWLRERRLLKNGYTNALSDYFGKSKRTIRSHLYTNSQGLLGNVAGKPAISDIYPKKEVGDES